MHANLVTWRVHESIRSPEAFEHFVDHAFPAVLNHLRPLGMIELYLIRTGPDSLISVGIYESADAAAAGLRQIGGTLREVVRGKLTVQELADGAVIHLPWYGRDAIANN